MSVKVTNHGKQRIKNRIGLSKKISDKISEKAYAEGITHGEATGSLKKYFDHLYLGHKKGNNIRLYNRKFFIFHDEILITILDSPHKFNNVEDKIKNKRLKTPE